MAASESAERRFKRARDRECVCGSIVAVGMDIESENSKQEGK